MGLPAHRLELAVLTVLLACFGYADLIQVPFSPYPCRKLPFIEASHCLAQHCLHGLALVVQNLHATLPPKKLLITMATLCA